MRRSGIATRAIWPRSAARARSPTIKGVQLSGFPAWVIWLVVHITYLIGFENRLIVLLRWGFSYVTRNRGARLIGRSEL